MHKRIVLLVCLLSPTFAFAATQYITDQLTVPLRRGPSNGHKIIHAGLPSGTPLEIVSEDKASGFTQVRTMSGTDGWVPSQYLVVEPSARDRLTAAGKRVESLTVELQTLRQSVKTEQSARSSAENTSGDLGKNVKRLEAELSEIRRVSASAVAQYEENRALKSQNAELQQAVTEQTQQLKTLRSNSLLRWLLAGGGLMALGLIFGVVIKSRPKRGAGW
ncbi:MAG: TIGR04211 family SH3 domain-containing protein [Candidatus Obscuribacterales bacterium]|nr:TIGR04211 family SH3 domain-containing protein [Steroidobacteraceae bacterium]